MYYNNEQPICKNKQCLIFQNFPIFQYLAMVTGSLNVVCLGMQYGWSSVALPKLLQKDSDIPLTNEEGSWVVVTLLIGTLCGDTFTAVFLDKLGRKRLMLIASAFLVISWTTLAYAKNMEMLILARFIGGLADGPIYCATPVYFSEVASPNARGFINGFIQVTNALGMLIITVVGLYVDLFDVAMISLIFPILSLTCLIWMPESPYYLIMKKKFSEAKKSISTFHPNQNLEYEFLQLNSAVENQTKNTGKFFDLFTVKSNRKSICIVIVLRAIQQMTGVIAITFYVETVFRESSKNSIWFNFGPILYFGTHIITAFVSSLIVDKVGRRLLMMLSLSGVALALFCQSCYLSLKNLTDVDVSSYDIIVTVALIGYILSFNIGMQAIPLTLVSEIFPTNVKAFAVSLTDAFFSLSVISVTKMFQFTKDEFGLHVSYYIFFSSSVLGCFFIYFFVPETKGKTLEEIQQHLKTEDRGKII